MEINGKRTILVIEDEKQLQEAIRMKLENSGFEVVTARTVEEGLNFMNDLQKIDVVWLDHYLLGKESGLDFVAKVKTHDTWRNIPVFLVSNTASEDKVKAYLQLGVQKYYTKADYRLDGIIEDIKKSIETSE